ncbi:AraC family transcriptional regulator [Sphaerotilus mobilis]|uniref:AraC family transcriptional regulator n=2 Tax=Sphaerotilus mobilis TaxID=47994 RepID=A0A4Q7LTP4_9BURK|nr:AraC family transcriptional regulator [Sphaerotilus mobilis]
MEPRFVDRAPLQVTGMKIITKPMSPEIPQLWPRFVSRIEEIDAILEPEVSYGVMEMLSGEPGGLSYLAAVSVAHAKLPLPEGMTSEEIPGGPYAVFEFPLADVGSAFGYIFETWLPASDYVQAASPIFERYNEKFDPTSPSSLVEAYIPIRPRSSVA